MKSLASTPQAPANVHSLARSRLEFVGTVGITKGSHGISDLELAQLASFPWDQLSPRLQEKFPAEMPLLKTAPETTPKWAQEILASASQKSNPL